MKDASEWFQELQRAALDQLKAASPAPAAAGGEARDASPTIREWQRTNAERNKSAFGQCADWGPTDWGCALGGETGELLNLLKKWRRDGPSPALLDAIQGEIGDVNAYTALIAEHFGLDYSDCSTTKFNEVSDRIGSPLKFAAGSDARDAEIARLKSENVALRASVEIAISALRQARFTDMADNLRKELKAATPDAEEGP
jgi:NTP pyrophosphatase (non-canonical NTP hydrolase)